ncbi:FusB/FusC family EF-G-binding protein [Planomicrobium sp. YIM 101495]|uniref:FusB/FusC family EF-G-binding protein n=1 Tax=Planomicrobium sp. YIM 101495 TaxID=2665160 RepID=UPI0012B76715|nr:elongation factor G-binding protein [Planomicrobium sp. YIM 101495]
MEAFIRNDQFNVIRKQALRIVASHKASTDQDVVDTIRILAFERVLDAFDYLNQKQKWLLDPLVDIESKADLERFLTHVKSYVLPFGGLAAPVLGSYFPKAKKMKTPSMQRVDARDYSYVGWNDPGAAMKYLILPNDGEWIGVSGSFRQSTRKGMCSLCQTESEVGLFLYRRRKGQDGTFIKNGHLICVDSDACNQNIMALGKIDALIQQLNN